jgi:hypothetical protein
MPLVLHLIFQPHRENLQVGNAEDEDEVENVDIPCIV